MLPVDYEPVMKASGAEELKDERGTEQARLETFVFRELPPPFSFSSWFKFLTYPDTQLQMDYARSGSRLIDSRTDVPGWANTGWKDGIYVSDWRRHAPPPRLLTLPRESDVFSAAFHAARC